MMIKINTNDNRILFSELIQRSKAYKKQKLYNYITSIIAMFCTRNRRKVEQKGIEKEPKDMENTKQKDIIIILIPDKYKI